MQRTVSLQSVWCIISLISIHSTSADFVKLKNHYRRPRSLVGDMNFGNKPGAGGMQGFNNVGPSDGLRNPEKPQMESIYRGKVVWGNVTEGANKEEVVFGKGRYADVETDKFGNPIEQPRRGPRPRINPLRKEDVKDEGRQKRSVEDPLRPKVELKTEQLTSEQLRKYHEFRANNDEIMDLIDNNIDKSINTVIKKAEEQRLVRKRSVNQQERKKRSINQQRVLKNNAEKLAGQNQAVVYCPPLNKSPFEDNHRQSRFEFINLENIPLEDRHEQKLFEFRNIDHEEKHEQSRFEFRNLEKIQDQSPLEFRKREKSLYKENLVKSPFKNRQEEGILGDGNSLKSHAVQKREVSYQQSYGPKIADINRGPLIESRYKGPVIESRYKGPVIRSQYMGPQIRSQYMGPQILSQYMGPQIVSEYKGKIIGMLGGVNAYEAFVKNQEAAEASTPQVVNLAQKYDRMNQEYQMQKIMAHMRNKPKLAKIFRER